MEVSLCYNVRERKAVSPMCKIFKEAWYDNLTVLFVFRAVSHMVP